MIFTIIFLLFLLFCEIFVLNFLFKFCFCPYSSVRMFCTKHCVAFSEADIDDIEFFFFVLLKFSNNFDYLLELNDLLKKHSCCQIIKDELAIKIKKIFVEKVKKLQKKI